MRKSIIQNVVQVTYFLSATMCDFTWREIHLLLGYCPLLVSPVLFPLWLPLQWWPQHNAMIHLTEHSEKTMGNPFPRDTVSHLRNCLCLSSMLRLVLTPSELDWVVPALLLCFPASVKWCVWAVTFHSIPGELDDSGLNPNMGIRPYSQVE